MASLEKFQKYSVPIAAIAALIAALSACVSVFQLITAKDTAERQLRAYVIIDSVSIGKIEPGELLIGFSASNVGQTPAYNLTTEMAIDLKEYPLTKDIPMHAHLDPNVAYFGKTVSPYEIRSKSFSSDDIEKILSGKKERLYVVGRSTYQDIFKVERHTNFCFMYAMTLSRGLQFTRCPPLLGARLNYAD